MNRALALIVAAALLLPVSALAADRVGGAREGALNCTRADGAGTAPGV